MPTVRIIPALDKAENGQAGLGLGREAPPGQEFALERREETFGHRIVETIADRPVRGPHAEFTAALPEGQRRILATLIAMMNHLLGTALGDRHRQRIEHEARS